MKMTASHEIARDALRDAHEHRGDAHVRALTGISYALLDIAGILRDLLGMVADETGHATAVKDAGQDPGEPAGGLI